MKLYNAVMREPGLGVTFHLPVPISVRWGWIVGVQIGRWFFGGIRTNGEGPIE